MHEALSNLEEVTVWFVWSKLSTECICAICFNFLSLRQDSEWIGDKLSSGFVENWQKGPVDQHWEIEFVFQCHIFRLAQSSTLCEGEVNAV